MSSDSSNGGSDRTRGGGSGGGGNGNGSGQRQGSDDQSDGQDKPSTPEKAVMAVSIVFTVLLFAYAGWQMAMTPSGTTPQPTVVGTETLENGSVAVTVRLRNSQGIGLISATVSSNCTSPPAEYRFTYVPAVSDRKATLVCPPGTSDPSVSISNWESR